MRKHGNRTYKRRRNDRQSRLIGTVTSEELDNLNDIEEQLRKQRLKKLSSVPTNASLSNIGRDSDVSPFTKKTLGRYTYDLSRGAYFPTKFVKNPTGSTSFARNDDFPKEHKDFRRPPVVAHAVQLLHGSTRRRHIVAQWAGQMIKESFFVEPNYDLYLDQMRLPQQEVTRGALESSGSCPWSRCFGVVSSQSSMSPPKYFTLDNSPYSHGKTLLSDEGIGCLDTWERQTTFTTFDTTGNLMSYDIIHDEINDFTQVQHSPEQTIFGGNKGQIWSSRAGSLFRMQFSKRESTVPSDILCVESDRSGSQPDLVFFGQRNGNVLVYDARTRLQGKKIVGTLSNRKRSDSSGDSVFSIKTMFEHRPEQILLRGSSSWGVCDLRRLGGCVVGNKSLIRNVSFSHSQDHLSIPGKGMAVDPLQSTIIVPFWNQTDASDKLNMVSLKFWSLESGSYLGAKTVQNELSDKRKVTPDRPKGQYPFASTDLELCPTVTHAWSFKPNFTEMGESRGTRRRLGSFGFWLKIGADHINHLSCIGRHDFETNFANKISKS